MTELVIIIVNYNTRDLLRRCLTEVRPQAAHLRAEVVVVDNASADGSVAMVRSEFSEVRVIADTENVGFARANNQAIRATDSKYVLLLNSDAFPSGDTFGELLRVMESDAQIAVAGPRMYDGNGNLLASAHAYESLLRLAVATFRIQGLMPRGVRRWAGRLLGKAGSQHLANYEAAAPAQVDWVSGACMLVRRAAIDKVGLLDERYFMYMEDEDWCRRLQQAGYKVVYAPTAVLTHLFAGSSESSARSARIYRASRLSYHRRYNPCLFPVCWLLSSLYAFRQVGVTGVFREHDNL